MIVVDAFLCYNQLVDESGKEGDFYLRLAKELIDRKYDSIQLCPWNGTAEKHPVLTLLVRMGGPGVVFISILPRRSGEVEAVTHPYTKGGARYAK